VLAFDRKTLLPEVDQQPNIDPRCREIVDQVDLVRESRLLHGLQLKQHAPGNQQVSREVPTTTSS
jgi:hypothetical protein